MEPRTTYNNHRQQEQLQNLLALRALTIHGRTRSQMYTGNADWTHIGEVKRNPRIHIPIISNGDIHISREAKRARRIWCGCHNDRASHLRAPLGCSKRCVTISIILATTELTYKEEDRYPGRILRINVERIDEKRGAHSTPQEDTSPLHLYLKGIANFGPTRIAMLRAETMNDLMAILEPLHQAPEIGG